MSYSEEVLGGVWRNE